MQPARVIEKDGRFQVFAFYKGVEYPVSNHGSKEEAEAVCKGNPKWNKSMPKGHGWLVMDFLRGKKATQIKGLVNEFLAQQKTASDSTLPPDKPLMF